MSLFEPPNCDRLHHLVDKFQGRIVVVLGDMVADEYIVGRPVRLSREAPLPVLEYVDRYIVPGGATNLATNVQSLGGTVHVAGVIGQDEAGSSLRKRLEEDNIGTAGLVEERGRPTSTKTRVIGGSLQVVSQQIARIDRVVHHEISDETKCHITAYLEQAIPAAEALIVSDYENGVINKDILATALPLARRHHLVCTVDAHGDLARFQEITIATPNQDEAAASLGIELDDDEAVCEAGRRLIDRMHADYVLITRGSQGMTLVESSGAYHHLQASSILEVRDATGAGDTVSGTVTLALLAGATAFEAASLGNIAAGIVVCRQGAATISASELHREIDVRLSQEAS